jgi:hypothetical protein
MGGRNRDGPHGCTRTELFRTVRAGAGFSRFLGRRARASGFDQLAGVLATSTTRWSAAAPQV